MSTRFGAKSSGMTLVEVMVAAFLGALIFYLMVSLLIPALRMSALGTTRVDLDQRATVMGNRLESALRRATRHSLVAGTVDGTHVLSVHQLSGSASGSKQAWSDSLTVFSWEAETKVLSERQVPLSESPVKATAPPLLDLLSAPGSKRFEIRDTEKFEVVIDAGPRVDFRLELAKGRDSLKMERTVFLVNSSQ